MAKLVTSDGQVQDVHPLDGKSFTLEELQKLVGGEIEILSTNDEHFVIVVNEDGKRLNLLHNRAATSMTSAIGMQPGDFICGNALIGTPIEIGCEPQE